MTHILVTGFDSFANHQKNPSLLLAQQVAQLFDQRQKVKAQALTLPVSDGGLDLALKRVQTSSFDRILCFGLAASITTPQWEFSAQNLFVDRLDSLNHGPQGQGEGHQSRIIVPEAAPVLQTQWEESALAQLTRVGAVKKSCDAGLYYCNRLYFLLLHHYPKLPSLFIHIPLTPIAPEIFLPLLPKNH